MSYLLVQIIAQHCEITKYDQMNLTSENADLNVRLSTEALFRVLDLQLEIVSKMCQQVPIPDQEFSAIGIKFKLTDLKFANADFQNTKGQNFGDHALFTINDASIKLIFQYTFQQETFPYVGGEGSGIADLVLDIQLDTGVGLSDTCQYHFALKNLHAGMQMKNFQLQLPDAPALIQALVNILTAVFENIFNEITMYWLNQLGDILNDNLNRGHTYNAVDLQFSTDQRNIAYELNDAMIFQTSGQMCNVVYDQQRCIGWQKDPQKISQKPQKFINRQVQFFMSTNAVQSVFDHINLMQLSTDEITVLKVVNTGVLVSVKNPDFAAHILCNIRGKTVNVDSDNYTQPVIVMKKVVQTSKQFDVEYYFNHMNAIFAKCVQNIYTFGFVDENEQTIIYQSPSWIIMGLDLYKDE